MGIFALSGLDTNKERKAKVKKIFTSLIKQYRQYELNETKQQTSQKSFLKKLSTIRNLFFHFSSSHITRNVLTIFC